MRGSQDYPREYSAWKAYKALFARAVPARALVVSTTVCEGVVLHERLEVASVVDGFQGGFETGHRWRTAQSDRMADNVDGRTAVIWRCERRAVSEHDALAEERVS